jgi:anti-sigma-K factor RskA
MSPDVHALTGAYALNAVNDLERAEFERHLAACEACEQEVRELRETAARLGQAAAAMPPPHLKGQVLTAITQVRQLPPDVGTVPPPRRAQRPGRSERSGWALRLSTAAAAVLLVASAVLGVLLVRERQAGEDSRQVAAVLQADDAQVFTAEVSTGGTASVVVSRAQNRAIVLTSGVAGLSESETFQLWTMNGEVEGEHTNVVSAGLMDRHQTIGDLRNADIIGITVEPAPNGSPTPTLPPVALLDIRA